jgi:acetylornithine deacetylase/succinyl-diaminopimelate desuccinylase-like protein
MAEVRGRWQRSLILVLLVAPLGATAQSIDAVRTLAQREKQPLLDTLKALVEIESGSSDIEGVTRIGTLIAERLRRLGGSVDLVAPAPDRLRITSLPQQFADTGRSTALRRLLRVHDNHWAPAPSGEGDDTPVVHPSSICESTISYVTSAE